MKQKQEKSSCCGTSREYTTESFLNGVCSKCGKSFIPETPQENRRFIDYGICHNCGDSYKKLTEIHICRKKVPQEESDCKPCGNCKKCNYCNPPTPPELSANSEEISSKLTTNSFTSKKMEEFVKGLKQTGWYPAIKQFGQRSEEEFIGSILNFIENAIEQAQAEGRSEEAINCSNHCDKAVAEKVKEIREHIDQMEVYHPEQMEDYNLIDKGDILSKLGE